MHASSRSLMVTVAVALALFVGAAPLAACSSGGQQADDTAETDVVEEEETAPEEEAEPEADESMWVKVSENYTDVPAGDDSGASASTAVTTYTRDNAGNLMEELYSDPNYGDIVYQYQVDENGWTTSMITAEEGADAQLTNYTNEFDANGLLVHSESESGSRDMTYYPDGQVKTINFTSTAYQYDEAGNRVEGSEHDVTNVVTFGEDGFVVGRESSLGTKTVSEYAYERDGEGRPVSCVKTIYLVDDEGNKGEVSSTANITFTYDENGNVAKIEIVSDYGTTTLEYEYELVKQPSAAARATEGLVSSF